MAKSKANEAFFQLFMVAQDELECLWGDLEEARRRAIQPGTWTIECEGLEERIKKLAIHCGMTPWEKLPLPLLEDGIYQRIAESMLIDPAVDMDKVRETRARIEEMHRG